MTLITTIHTFRNHGLKLKTLISIILQSSTNCVTSSTGWPKKVCHYQIVKKLYKTCLSLPIILDLFAKLKYELSTIILFVCTIYSMRDLLSDLNNYA